MKPTLTFLLIFTLWTIAIGKANAPEITETIRTSLRGGQAHELALCFDRQIELVIDAETVDFPVVRAEQAEQILKTFFKKYPPRNFQYVYQGSTARMRYSTGTYQSNGQTFSVYVLMKQSARQPGGYVVNTLHLRKA
jgi:hypothetical protein